MAKKKQPAPPKARPGRPRQFAEPRVMWTIWLDQDMAAAAERWRAERGLTQSAMVVEMMRKTLGGKR